MARDEIAVRQEQPRGIEIALHESPYGAAARAAAARSHRESTPTPAHGAPPSPRVERRGAQPWRSNRGGPETPAQAR